MVNGKWKIFFSLSTNYRDPNKKRTGTNACPTFLFRSGPARMSPVLPIIAKVSTPIATVHP